MSMAKKHESKINDHKENLTKNDVDTYAKQICRRVVIRKARTNNGIVTWFYNFPDNTYSKYVET